MSITDALQRAVDGENLSREEAYTVMMQIMSGDATDAQIAGFLVALRMKGETIEEITGFAQAMREKAVRIEVDRHPLVDTCGTGGDALDTFNISTATAFVAAGAGIAVAKHGNRSVTSQCGSADVLEELGYNLNLPPERVRESIEEIGIGFLFAPAFHPAMKYAIGPRRQMGIRTVFNILGPLTNPAGATAQVMGVFAPSLTEPLARVLGNLGAQRAFVVHGLDGLDELSISGATQVSELNPSGVTTYRVHPQDFGLTPASVHELRGGSRRESADLLVALLRGEVKGAKRDVVLLNAAAAITAGNLAPTIADALPIACEAIDSGRAYQCLKALLEFSARVSEEPK
ncbi:MAG TPA: anthranilate phosphoribosyltransferase [Armatimonadetes bacterium]|nr:anthranilate phosphoribosyltransferase [Armatimonadota bacterium]